MVLFIKKHRSKALKIAGAILFAILMFLNISLTTNQDANKKDIDLAGVKMSMSSASAAGWVEGPKMWDDNCGGYICLQRPFVELCKSTYPCP